MKEKTSHKAGNIIITLIVIILIIVLLFVGWNKFQEYMFFHPWNDKQSSKKLQEIEEFTEVKIKNDKVDLYGWFWNIQKEDTAPLVIFFTGNAQNASNTMYNFYLSGMDVYFSNYNLMIVDYPGYGISKGKPSDDSMFEASKYIFEYALTMPEVDNENIVIMGYSIGTGVASYCASTNDAKALILVAPYDKALSLYNDAVDSFHGSVQSLARYSFDSATYAESVNEPTLIFTSKADEVINYKHSLDLAGHFSELEDVVILEDIDHNSYFSEQKVLDGIKEFLDKNSH